MSRQTYRDDVELGMIPLQGRKSLDRAWNESDLKKPIAGQSKTKTPNVDIFYDDTVEIEPDDIGHVRYSIQLLEVPYQRFLKTQPYDAFGQRGLLGGLGIEVGVRDPYGIFRRRSKNEQ